MTDPNISIIILNWNGWEDTLECLESLFRINYDNYKVIIIDNGSNDDSIDKIRDYCKGNIKINSAFIDDNISNKPIELIEYTKEEAIHGIDKEKGSWKVPSDKKLILIKNANNLGFARGVNVGLKYSISHKTDGVLLLNNDMVVERNFLLEMVKNWYIDTSIGILSPKVYYYSDRKKINFCYSEINLWTGRTTIFGGNIIDNGQFDEVKEVNYAHGGCTLIKGEVIEIVGLFDPDFFLYYEDMDYCIRARHKGFKIIYVPFANVWHKGGSTSRKSGLIHYHSFKGRLQFMGKHTSIIQLIFFILWFISREVFFITIDWIMYKQKRNELVKRYQGIIDGTLMIMKRRLTKYKE